MLQNPTKYLFLSLLVFLVACEKTVKPKSMGETEYYYDEKLSSLSLDEDGSFWIGSETGDLINFKDNHRLSYDLGEDRIYKVIREVEKEDLSTFWIGVRNSGLQKWEMKRDDKPIKKQTYQIHFKKDKYSAYDVASFNKWLFVATSQGLYRLDRSSSTDTLALVYPSQKFLSEQNGYSFVTHNICTYKDSLLFASTQKGLLRLDVSTHKLSTLFEELYIDHVSIYEDKVYIVGSGYLLITDLEGHTFRKIEIGHSPKLYYQTEGIHYLVGTQELLLSNDLEEFLSVNLRRSVPLGGRNVVLSGQSNHFTYLLTDNAVWRIANHMDVFKGNISIKAACDDKYSSYYLTSRNELYWQDKVSNEAKWVYTFPKENEIDWMDIIDHELYFYSSNEFKKIAISKSWLKNMLFNAPTTILKSKAKITAAAVKKIDHQVYSFIGIQDGLIRIDHQNRIDTIPEFNNVYVTSIFNHPHIDRLYFSTLNDGVFYMTPESIVKKVSKTSQLSFLKDIMTTNDHNATVMMLTNHHIITQNPTDSIQVKGYNKLLYVSDTLFYALPEFGIHKFVLESGEIKDRGLFYQDIRFNGRASFSSDYKLYLGSNLGEITFDAGEEDNLIWVSFEDPLNINILYSALFFILILFVFTTLGVLWVRRKNTKASQIERRKEDLEKRTEELIAFYNLVEKEEIKEVKAIERRIDAIDIEEKDRKVLNALFDELSLDLINLNREIALLLPKKLEEQVSLIRATHSFDKELLLAESLQVEKENDIENIKAQVNKNREWLKLRTTLLTSIDDALLNLEGCFELDGVNKGLYHRMISLKSNDKLSLSLLVKEFEFLKADYDKIQSDEAFAKVRSFMTEALVYVQAKLDDCVLLLKDSLLELNRSAHTLNRFELLKRLKPINDQVLILKKIDELSLCIEEYKKKRDEIVLANEDLVNKKFDKELDALIEQESQSVVTQIEQLISEFYTLVAVTDNYILTEVLKFTNYYNQQAKVLALLIANPKVKRTLIPGLLGVYGNLNPVISRLINNRIKANEEELKSYCYATKQSVFVCYLLRLIE